MTPDQLRALADALSRQRQADEHGIYCAVPRQAVDAAIKYLRAQADAQPVAPAVPAGWKLVPVEPTPEMLHAEVHGSDWNGRSGDERARAVWAAVLAAAPTVPQADALPVSLVRAYNAGYMAGHHDTVEGGFVDIHPSDMDTYHADVVAELGLPAVPQAEPIDPHMIVAEDRFPDEQAEPKREPTCLWSRADDDTDVWETSCGHAFTIIEGTPSDNHMEFCCYCGRRVDEEIGGSDE